MAFLETAAQYGDWVGTADADDETINDVQQFLRARECISDEELVAALEYGKHERMTIITALVAPVGAYDRLHEARNERGLLRLRRVPLELTTDEFFAMFKRVGFALVRAGLDIEGGEYEVIEDVED